MNVISAALKTAYNAHVDVVIPSGGTYGMELIARQFAAAGVQIAAVVPLEWGGEGPYYKSFHIGAIGLDKLHHIDRTVIYLEAALDQVMA